MACKIFVNHPGSMSSESVVALQKRIADHLHVCPEDVVVMPGLTLSVVEVPEEMNAAREKADKQAAKEEAERVKAEEEAAEKQAKAEAKAAADAEKAAAKEAKKAAK